MLLLSALPLAVDAKPLYRYRNAEGITVVDFQVPLESIGNGYEVLNEKGMVVKVVPRELTEEERQEKDAQERLLAAAKAEEERLRKLDESLMLRYSTVADIEDARRRAMGNLEIRLAILRGNRRGYKQQVENYQSQLADTERAGFDVDMERLREIENLQKEIQSIDRDIETRELEIEVLGAKFQADIDRFEMLQEAVDMRRALSNKQSSQ
ncbi:MAG: hypothetical protein HRT77_01910 [Halioglobus sp.]|nr:hypothetical protein [Halioglobus sp.]